MRGAAVLLWLFASTGAWALEAGARLPDLSLPALESGAPVALSSLKGKVVYVDFWASWCVPCRLSMPKLDALYRQHADKGFVVVGVNKDTGVPEAERFLKKVSVTFPLARDGGDAAARAFDVKAMPSGYLVDRKGVVRYIHRGFTEETAVELEKQVDALLKESP
jgi:thiol-disulfide isomerase/thioredoxin